MPEHLAHPHSPVGPPDSQPPRRKTKFWPILVTLIGGIVLAYGSLSVACSPTPPQSDFARASQWVLGPIFIVGISAALFGSLWLIVALFLHLFYFARRK